AIPVYRIVRELATDARQPMPRLYLSPTRAPNAFTTGWSRRGAALCCTTGLLSLLDERELRGVIAHELTHLRRGDTVVGTVAAMLALSITSRSEEHTSELQSRENLVCRLLLEKKK